MVHVVTVSTPGLVVSYRTRVACCWRVPRVGASCQVTPAALCRRRRLACRLAVSCVVCRVRAWLCGLFVRRTHSVLYGCAWGL